jgi:hypothetical protein
MDEKSIAYATYWRTSLADAELSSGALKKSDASAFKQCTEAELESGRLGKSLTAELFAGEAEDVEKVAITIRPMSITLISNTGRSGQLALGGSKRQYVPERQYPGEQVGRYRRRLRNIGCRTWRA